VARLVTNTLNKSTDVALDRYAYMYNQANQRTNVTRFDLSYYGFAYDKIGQLTVADSSVNTEDRGYLYDAAWNLNDRTNNGAITAFNVDVDNQLTTEAGLNCTYDANGNLTQVGDRFGMSTVNYVYDDENRLVEVYTNSAPTGPTGGGGPWDSLFTYDGLGRLRQRQEYVNGGLTATVEYVYDGNRVIEERDGNNNPTVAYTRGSDLSSTFEGAGGIGGLLARSDQFSLGNFTRHNYYFADGNGNITYMTAANQGAVASYRYDPFGNTISFNGILASVNLYRFSSKEIHANSGMYYYLYRFYDPNLQRWINRDPIQEWGGINLYAFVGNAPVNLVDSFGEYMSFWHFLGTELGEFYRGNFLGAIPVAAQSVLADFRPGSQGTDAAHANRHAMAGLLPNGCYQTADEARKATENYINDRLAQYRQDHRWWNPFSGSQALGDAYHAIQDSYASGHNYQEWHGRIPSPSHIAGDFLGVPPLFPVVNRISHGLE
jgi:RHS repeat-associated protein